MPLILTTPYKKIVQIIGDAFRDNVSILFHAEGEDSAKVLTNSGYGSVSNFVFTGDARLTRGVKKFGVSSLFFNGAGYISGPSAESGTVLDSGDFTIEAWVRPLSNGNCNILSRWQNQSYIFGISNGAAAFAWAPFNTNVTMLVGSQVPLNEWSHLAVSRKGNIWRLFLNGVITATREFNGNATPSNAVATLIGAYRIGTTGATGPFHGYVDELRVTKGVARYTENFAVPTEAFV